MSTGRAERDPSGDLRGAIPPPQSRNFASIKDEKGVGELLRAIDGYRGNFVTKCALRLAPQVFVRPGELRAAVWDEIDLARAEWRIPAGRMKMRDVHIVPLSHQAVAVLHEIEPLTSAVRESRPDAPRYVFPIVRTADRPMSNNTVLSALRRLDYEKDEMTGHGFRSIASTIAKPLAVQRPIQALANFTADVRGSNFIRSGAVSTRFDRGNYGAAMSGVFIFLVVSGFPAHLVNRPTFAGQPYPEPRRAIDAVTARQLVLCLPIVPDQENAGRGTRSKPQIARQVELRPSC